MASILPLSLLTAAVWLGGPGAPEVPELATEAERIARLERSIESDRKEIEQIKNRLEAPAGEYRQAEAVFIRLDARVEEWKREIREFRDLALDDKAMECEGDGQPLLQSWEAARDRFNLAIAERKTLQAKAAALGEKIKHDQEALAQLVGATVEVEEVAEPGQADAAAGDAPPAEKLQQAQDALRKKEAAARAASDRANSATERLESLRTNIQLEEQLLETARRRSDQAHQEQGNLEKTLETRLAAGANEATIQGILNAITEARRRANEARAAVRACSDRIHDLQADLVDRQQEELAARGEAAKKHHEAQEAQTRLAELENPLAARNLVPWLIRHGAMLLVIAAGMAVLYRLVRHFSQRIVQVLVRSGSRGTEQERENRAQTLVGVFRNVASLVIVVGGTLMFLDTLGIPIVPLLGGAAVLGLAVAFGAQNLIKDYFSGFMVLMEDQYGLDDVVRIGPIAGKVERLTLRMTVLRDNEGVVHFIPHGTISSVSNLTHGWSRAFFAIGVAYSTDLDRAMAELMDLARQLRQDPKFAPLILDEAEMLGVDAFESSAIVIKFFIKTRPLKQWLVKREMLRRIKKRFDECGIEIPFPHHTVYHRYEGDAKRRPQAAA